MKIKSYNYNKANSLELKNGMKILISYETPVAAFIYGQLYISEEWYNGSKTTNKHLCWFCRKSEGIKKPQKFFDDLI